MLYFVVHCALVRDFTSLNVNTTTLWRIVILYCENLTVSVIMSGRVGSGHDFACDWPVGYRNFGGCDRVAENGAVDISVVDWIGTLSFCVSLTCAPLSVGIIRSLGPTYGYRICGLLGTVLLSVSCIGSSFVRQPEWLFLSHSLLYGIGSSLVYMASSLVIGDHFRHDHKYHVLATSILLCGYPLGNYIRLFLCIQSRCCLHLLS